MHDEDEPDRSHHIYGEVNPFHWIRSSIGNAYHSGVSYDQLWWATMMADTPEQFDAAISAAEELNLLIKRPTSGV